MDEMVSSIDNTSNTPKSPNVLKMESKALTALMAGESIGS